jgi:hypothetical protein
MKTIKKLGAFVAIGVLALAMGGCAGSYQARSVELKDSMLVNPSILKVGGDDQALYRYVSPNFKAEKYTKLIIDPVLIYKDGDMSESERANYQTLANNALFYLVKELSDDYTMVTAPEPGAMRLQFAIVDADSSKPVRNLTSSVMPIGIGLSLVKLGAVGKMSGVGEITGEIKVTDAMTGELLGAALDRRVGGKNPKGIFDTWYNADEALKYWAKQVRYVMCTERGAANCVKPD